MRTSFSIDDFGNTYEYDLDSGERIDNNYQLGDGILDVITSISKKVVSKLSGKTAKDVAKKAATKVLKRVLKQLELKWAKLFLII